jgi:hypothetical protein
VAIPMRLDPVHQQHIVVQSQTVLSIYLIAIKPNRNVG